MPEILIEQATFLLAETPLPKLLGKSPGVLDAWIPELQSVVIDYGTPLHGIRCPEAMFALPFGKRHVVIARVCDDVETVSEDHPLYYQVLIVRKKVYLYGLPDPFYILDQFPPEWRKTELPTLEWTFGPLPRRTVSEVQAILKRLKSNALLEDQPVRQQTEESEREYTDEEIANAWGPTFLGGVQILVDGGRLIFQRRAPDPELIRAFWTLLPNSSRADVWPATFAFNNALPFDLLVVPIYDVEDFHDHVTEDQAAEYPEGRYEVALQRAAETDDQEELDILFHRRGSRETLRLAIILVIAMTVLVLVNNFLSGPLIPPPPRKSTSPTTQTMASSLAGKDKLRATAGVFAFPQSFPTLIQLGAAYEAFAMENDQ